MGLRPTIGGTQVVTEVNIFDFDEDIYGQSLCMVFLARLRKEKKFRNLDALVRQIKTDKKKAVSLYLCLLRIIPAFICVHLG